MKICVFLLLLSGQSVMGSIRDLILDKFNTKEDMQNIKQLLVPCRSADLRHDNCSVIEYLAEIEEDKTRALKFPSNTNTVTTKVPTIQDKFSDLFQHYVMAKLPFKSKLSNQTIDISACVAEIDQKIIGPANPVTEDISLFMCSGHSSVLVPVPAANNFLFRFNASAEDHRESGVDSFDHYTQWPALLPLTPGVPTTVKQCPDALHQIFVNAADKTVRIRLFSSSFGLEFEPTVPGELAHLPLHRWVFKKTGFPKLLDQSGGDASAASKKYSVSRHVEVALEPGEYIFIPNNLLASLVVEGEGAAAGATPLHLLRYCVLDAANINEFRAALALSAKVSTADKKTIQNLSQISKLRMSINPSDVTMSSLPETAAVAAAAAGTAAEVVPEAVAEPPQRVRRRGEKDTASVAGSVGSSGSAAGSSYREWQDVKKWDNLISSLTILSPGMPAVAGVGRTNMTVQWPSFFVPEAADTTKFGFNLTICQLFGSTSAEQREACLDLELGRPSASLLETAVTDSDGVTSTVFSTLLLSLLPNSEYRFRVVLFYGKVATVPSPWSHTVTTAPLTAPSAIPSLKDIKAITRENQSSGASSGLKIKKKRKVDLVAGRNLSVEAVHTSPTSTSITLSFLRPFDDGGVALSGYRVFGRHVDSSAVVSLEWQELVSRYLGASTLGYETVEVYYLFAETRYEFQVVAYNTIGDGPVSEVSNTVLTNRDPGLSSIYRKLDLNASVLFTVNMDTERVSALSQSSFISGQETALVSPLAAWKCHWSPRSIAYGALAMAEPVTAEVALSNAAQVVGKIVVVKRGVVPLVHKIRHAQAAGAIGVIIVDDGSCVSGKFDQACLPGSDRAAGEAFASHDEPKLWLVTRIPVLFVLEADAIAFFSSLQAIHPDGVMYIQALQSGSAATTTTATTIDEL